MVEFLVNFAQVNSVLTHSVLHLYGPSSFNPLGPSPSMGSVGVFGPLWGRKGPAGPQKALRASSRFVEAHGTLWAPLGLSNRYAI